MTVNLGKMHNYLRMVHDYSMKSAVQITMYHHIKNMWAEQNPMMDGESRTTVPFLLFEVN